MAEPTLSEIANISSDAGRSGIAPTPLIDTSKIADRLSDAAKIHAEYTWKKYTQFLENKKDLFKNIGDIQGLEVAPEDRDILKKQAGDILSEILKDPSIAIGGAGYDQLQGKIAKFKSDAMASKGDQLDRETNKKFMDRNPDLYSDENVAALESNMKAPLGTRKSIMLQMPTIFDEKKTFEDILKGATQPYTAVVGPDGKPGAGYIETGNEVNPNAISELWKMALQGQKDKYGHSILNAVSKNFDKLSEPEKKRYKEQGGDPIENYFTEKGQKYLGAYFPQGSYEATPEGNYRFGKKLNADPNYLGQERLSLAERALAQKANFDRQRIAVDWAEYGLKKEKLLGTDSEDLSGANTVLNEASSMLKNATQQPIVDPNGKKRNILRISDPTLLQSFGNIDKDGKTTNVPDAINYDPVTNQPVLLYFKKKPPPKLGEKTPPPTGEYYEREIPLDQRTWLKHITKRSFPNKDIGKINQLLEDVLNKNGNDLYGLSQKVIQQQQQPAQQPAQAPVKTKTKKVDDPLGIL